MDVEFIPASRMAGDNIAQPVKTMGWYKSQMALEVLDPLHKQGEPRALTLRRVALEIDGWRAHGRMLDAIAAELAQRKGKSIPINLAGAIAAVLADLGFEPLMIGGLGALGYGFALLAHIVEEIHEGVPLRIIPEALGAHYAGPAERHLPPERKRRSRR